MPRRPRIFLPGHPQHVVVRGHDRGPIIGDNSDCQTLVAFLDDALTRYEVPLHAWTLMTNHMHLLVTPGAESGISRAMQWFGARYAHFLNQCHGRRGPLWERRYRSSLVGNDRYFLLCHRYIEMNPVRGGMVAAPGDYPWSSYCQNAGILPGREKGPELKLWPLKLEDRCQSFSSYPAVAKALTPEIRLPRLTPHELYLALGSTDERRHRVYRALFDEVLDTRTLGAFRRGMQSRKGCQS